MKETIFIASHLTTNAWQTYILTMQEATLYIQLPESKYENNFQLKTLALDTLPSLHLYFTEIITAYNLKIDNFKYEI